MRWVLPVSFIFAVVACKDNVKIKTVSRAKPLIIPEVASTIEVVTDASGTIRTLTKEGATRYGARILDATCGEALYDLGVQETPEFTLPTDAYFKPLCLETTYFDANNKVMEVKLQPFTFEGPAPIDYMMARDKQELDFQDVKDAASYSYLVFDKNGQIKTFEAGLPDSFIDLKNSLTIGEYKLVVLALDAKGKTVQTINFNLKIVPGSISDVSLNLHFEREHYQTRSIKRLLVETGYLNETVSLVLNEQAIDTAINTNYNVSFGSIMDAQDAMMRGKLPYNGSKVKVQLQSLSDSTFEVSVKVKDFTAFSLFPVAFSDGAYAKSGLESWTAIVAQPTVSSGAYQMANNFGLMILQ